MALHLCQLCCLWSGRYNDVRIRRARAKFTLFAGSKRSLNTIRWRRLLSMTKARSSGVTNVLPALKKKRQDTPQSDWQFALRSFQKYSQYCSICDKFRGGMPRTTTAENFAAPKKTRPHRGRTMRPAGMYRSPAKGISVDGGAVKSRKSARENYTRTIDPTPLDSNPNALQP